LNSGLAEDPTLGPVQTNDLILLCTAVFFNGFVVPNDDTFAALGGLLILKIKFFGKLPMIFKRKTD